APVPTLLLCSHGDIPARPSFPTRRSSDLGGAIGSGVIRDVNAASGASGQAALPDLGGEVEDAASGSGGASTSANGGDTAHAPGRSEEHTSELQSLRHLVCRLLLEKRKVTA